MVEAMSLGCPVLCSNNSTFKELAGNSVAYFNPHDLGDFKFQLEKLIYSLTNLNKNKILGFERSKNFTWKKCAGKTFEVYKSLT